MVWSHVRKALAIVNELIGDPAVPEQSRMDLVKLKKELIATEEQSILLRSRTMELIEVVEKMEGILALRSKISANEEVEGNFTTKGSPAGVEDAEEDLIQKLIKSRYAEFQIEWNAEGPLIKVQKTIT